MRLLRSQTTVGRETKKWTVSEKSCYKFTDEQTNEIKFSQVLTFDERIIPPVALLISQSALLLV